MSHILEQISRRHTGEPLMMLLDVGYLSDQKARSRADQIIAAGVSRRNLSIEGFNRIFIRVPPTKIARILALFPIMEGTAYYQSTHHWLEDGPDTASEGEMS